MSLPAGEAPSEIETAGGEQDADIPRTSAQRSISMEQMDIERDLESIPAERRTWSRFMFLWICGISIFLAPVIIVSGMTASHGDGWKQMFFG
jgi:cytosine/uracil/thiamine/allantoin permease